jgi:hypothetical protein
MTTSAILSGMIGIGGGGEGLARKNMAKMMMTMYKTDDVPMKLYRTPKRSIEYM